MSQSIPPPPPPPPLPFYVPRGPAKKPAAQTQPKPPAGSLKIGIETEVLLRGRNRPPANENIFPRFARRCAALYNSTINPKFPRMYSLVQTSGQECHTLNGFCITIQPSTKQALQGSGVGRGYETHCCRRAPARTTFRRAQSYKGAATILIQH